MVKTARRLLMGLLALVLAAALGAAALIGFVYMKEVTLPERGDSDVIIVLGAQVKPDGTPSEALRRRLAAALEVYREKRQVIIVCGAQGGDEPRAEGDVMRDWLVAEGALEEDVVAETASFNTRQNLEYAKAIMEHRGLREALIVTSDYHVARALELCARVCIRATGKGSPSKPEYFLKNHLREGLSWIKFWLEDMR